MKTWIAATLLFATPAFADEDAAFKAQVEAFTKSWAVAFNAGNADAVLALYAPDGVFVGADGDTEHGEERRKALEALFAMGLQDQVTVAEAHRFGDAGFAVGSYSFAVPGKPIKGGGNWTAAYVVEGGQLKIKLLAASVPPPKP